MIHKTSRPFTLIELIAVMGVMILLAAVAIPAYSSLFSGRKTTLAANQLNGAIMEARAHAVSSKNYTALVFVKDGNGYKSFRMAEIYHNPDTENSFAWRRWVPGTAFVLLPENTMVPATNDDLGTTSSGTDGNKGSDVLTTKITNLNNSGLTVTSNVPAIIVKPNGQLAGTKDKNVVVRFVESNRYEANQSKTPKLPLNINWLTCKAKYLDPVE
jgi:type II secretory pathway pseudopilin PulG